MPTNAPNVTAIINFAVIIMTRKFVNDYSAMFYVGMDIGHIAGITFAINNGAILNPSDGNTFVGFTQFLISDPAHVLFTLKNLIYDLNVQYPGTYSLKTLWLGYTFFGNSPILFKSTFFTFSDTAGICPGFFQYTGPLFENSPHNCSACSPECLTCLSNPIDFNTTNTNRCLTCTARKYLEVLSTEEGVNVGNCWCYPGLTIDPVSYECSLCQYKCLSYNIAFMLSSTKSEFLIIFSH